MDEQAYDVRKALRRIKDFMNNYEKELNAPPAIMKKLQKLYKCTEKKSVSIEIVMKVEQAIEQLKFQSSDMKNAKSSNQQRLTHHENERENLHSHRYKNSQYRHKRSRRRSHKRDRRDRSRSSSGSRSDRSDKYSYRHDKYRRNNKDLLNRDDHSSSWYKYDDRTNSYKGNTDDDCSFTSASKEKHTDHSEYKRREKAGSYRYNDRSTHRRSRSKSRHGSPRYRTHAPDRSGYKTTDRKLDENEYRKSRNPSPDERSRDDCKLDFKNERLVPSFNDQSDHSSGKNIKSELMKMLSGRDSRPCSPDVVMHGSIVDLTIDTHTPAAKYDDYTRQKIAQKSNSLDERSEDNDGSYSKTFSETSPTYSPLIHKDESSNRKIQDTTASCCKVSDCESKNGAGNLTNTKSKLSTLIQSVLCKENNSIRPSLTLTSDRSISDDIHRISPNVPVKRTNPKYDLMSKKHRNEGAIQMTGKKSQISITSINSYHIDEDIIKEIVDQSVNEMKASSAYTESKIMFDENDIKSALATVEVNDSAKKWNSEDKSSTVESIHPNDPRQQRVQARKDTFRMPFPPPAEQQYNSYEPIQPIPDKTQSPYSNHSVLPGGNSYNLHQPPPLQNKSYEFLSTPNKSLSGFRGFPPQCFSYPPPTYFECNKNQQSLQPLTYKQSNNLHQHSNMSQASNMTNFSIMPPSNDCYKRNVAPMNYGQYKRMQTASGSNRNKEKVTRASDFDFKKPSPRNSTSIPNVSTKPPILNFPMKPKPNQGDEDRTHESGISTEINVIDELTPSLPPLVKNQIKAKGGSETKKVVTRKENVKSDLMNNANPKNTNKVSQRSETITQQSANHQNNVEAGSSSSNNQHIKDNTITALQELMNPNKLLALVDMIGKLSDDDTFTKVKELLEDRVKESQSPISNDERMEILSTPVEFVNTAVPKTKKKKNELDRLNEDIDNMFIRDGVLKANGRRLTVHYSRKDLSAKRNIENDMESKDGNANKKLKTPTRLIRAQSISRIETNHATNEVKPAPATTLRARSKTIYIEKPKPIRITPKVVEELPAIQPQTSRKRKRTFKGLEYLNNKKASVQLKPLTKNNNPEMHSLKKIVECQICYGPSGLSIVNHYVNDHPDSEVLTSRLPPEAGKLFRSTGEVNRCEIVRLPGSNSYQFKQFCFFCNIYKCFSRRNWITHLATHSGYYQFKCIDCSKKFSAKPQKGHVCVKENLLEKIPQPEFEKREITAYVCDLCNFVRFDKSEMEKHFSCEHDDNVNRSLTQGLFLTFPKRLLKRDMEQGYYKKAKLSDIEDDEENVSGSEASYVLSENLCADDDDTREEYETNEYEEQIEKEYERELEGFHDEFENELENDAIDSDDSDWTP